MALCIVTEHCLFTSILQLTMMSYHNFLMIAVKLLKHCVIVVTMLSKNIMPDEVTLPIRRDYMLEDALQAVRRKHFLFNHTLKVSVQISFLDFSHIYV